MWEKNESVYTPLCVSHCSLLLLATACSCCSQRGEEDNRRKKKKWLRLAASELRALLMTCECKTPTANAACCSIALKGTQRKEPTALALSLTQTKVTGQTAFVCYLTLVSTCCCSAAGTTAVTGQMVMPLWWPQTHWCLSIPRTVNTENHVICASLLCCMHMQLV